jgi:hypothetical protein
MCFFTEGQKERVKAVLELERKSFQNINSANCNAYQPPTLCNGCEVAIYPNPNKGQFVFVFKPFFKSSYKQVTMYNNLGQEIAIYSVTELTDNSVRVDVNLPSGIYYVALRNEYNLKAAKVYILNM